MEAYLTSVTEPRWFDEEKTCVSCFITTTQFGDEKLPFLAAPYDPEAHGQKIYADLISGVYGPIGDYVPEPLPQISQDGSIPTAVL